MDIDRLSRSIGGAVNRRTALAGMAAALLLPPARAGARRGGKGLLDYDQCLDRLEEDICRQLPFYDRRICSRAVARCCKESQLTLRNATRCVEQSLPPRR